MIFRPNGGKLKQKHPLPWLRIWWWGRERDWGDLNLVKGECGPMWSQPICQHQALSEPPPTRTMEMNWCGPRAYLPLGCWWDTLKKINTYTAGRICYLNLSSSSIFVRGTDGNKDVFLKLSVPCISHLTPQKPSTAVEPEQHFVPWPSPGDPHPKIKFRLPSWKAEYTFRIFSGRGLLPVKTPTVGCLPSFHFSKGAKTSFRK